MAAVAEAAPASPPAAAAAAVAVPPPSWDWRKAAARSLLAARSWARSALDTSFRTGAADKLRLAAAHAAVRAATQDALESMVRQDTFAVLWWPPAVGRLITHWVAALPATRCRIRVSCTTRTHCTHGVIAAVPDGAFAQ